MPAMFPGGTLTSLLSHEDACIADLGGHKTLCEFGREIRDADQAWPHILDELRQLSPALENPDCHRLVSSKVFL